MDEGDRYDPADVAAMREASELIQGVLAKHEHEVHDDEPCAAERGNVLAFIAHKIGADNRECLIVAMDRMTAYRAMHAEHHVDDPHRTETEYRR